MHLLKNKNHIVWFYMNKAGETNFDLKVKEC